MNYKDIKKYLENFGIKYGYEEVIKGLLSFELDEENEEILEEVYEYYFNYDELHLLNDLLLDKYEELKEEGEEECM